MGHHSFEKRIESLKSKRTANEGREEGDQCLSVHPLKKGVAKFKQLLSLIEPIKVFALKSVHKKVAKVGHSIGKVERDEH